MESFWYDDEHKHERWGKQMYERIKTFFHLLWDFSHNTQWKQKKLRHPTVQLIQPSIQIDIPWRLLWSIEFAREKRNFFNENNFIQINLFFIFIYYFFLNENAKKTHREKCVETGRKRRKEDDYKAKPHQRNFE